MLTILELEEKAQASQEAGESDALALCKKLLKRDPNNLIAHFHLALIYRHQKRLKKALAHAQEVRKLNPHEGNIYLNLGAIYSDMGEMKKAIRCYKRELQQDPENAQTLCNLGNRYFERRRWKTAAMYYAKCFDLKFDIENYAEYVVDLVACYQKTERYQEEVAFYKRYLKFHPNNVWALQNLGGALIDVGEYDKSLRYSRQAQKVLPDDAMIQRNIKLAKKLKAKKRGKKK